ncbi:unnamed protein product [Umbelopsis ramanniana]
MEQELVEANVLSQQCLSRLSGTCERKCDSLVLSSLSNETLKGVISLLGTKIIKGDLQIRLPNYHRDSQIKACISENNPYHLEQARNCQNYTQLAIDLIDCHPGISSICSVSNFLEDILKYVKQAQMAFNSPSEAKSFPYRVCQPKHFTPPLPEDLVVEISIDHIHVLCNVYALELHQHQKSDKYIPYKDKFATVLDECRVRTQSPLLTDIAASLTKAADICSEFQLKLIQISAIQE